MKKNMNTVDRGIRIALALAACFAAGQYFTGAIVAFVLIAGQLLEERSMIGVQQAVRHLLNLTRVFAHRLVPGGMEERVDAASLLPGDTVRVRVRRGEREQILTVELATLQEGGTLPPGHP